MRRLPSHSRPAISNSRGTAREHQPTHRPRGGSPPLAQAAASSIARRGAPVRRQARSRMVPARRLARGSRAPADDAWTTSKEARRRDRQSPAEAGTQAKGHGRAGPDVLGLRAAVALRVPVTPTRMGKSPPWNICLFCGGLFSWPVGYLVDCAGLLDDGTALQLALHEIEPAEDPRDDRDSPAVSDGAVAGRILCGLAVVRD